jgi:trehalose synthase
MAAQMKSTVRDGAWEKKGDTKTADKIDNPATHHRPLIQLEDYEPYMGGKTVERLRAKAAPWRGMRVAHVNSTFYGGGVAELLSSLTLLMSSAGLITEWRAILGRPDYFNVTKKIHNALQGADINLTDLKMEIYEQVAYENSVRNVLDHDFVVIHDPQPLPLISHYKKHGPWTWRCHLDLSHPNRELWNYLKPFIESYDALVLSLPEYRQQLQVPEVFFPPTIDPFTTKNKELSDAEINERLAHYEIPTDLPLVVQISRFDRWKDPEGVIEAFRLARREVDCTLVLLGDVATDDPEGEEVYRSLLDAREERIIILSAQDSAVVNALQRRATVVLQKSLREGFGLTVTEAMWKGAAVIGGDVGGIRHQIQDGENGFLVSSVQQAAERIVQLLKDEKLRRNIGAAARETVRRNFLLPYSLEHYLDLFASFKTIYRFEPSRQS